MVLLNPIAPMLFADPVIAYQELTADLAPEEKYKQNFCYDTVEIPLANVPKRLEEMYPKSTVLGIDGDIVSSEPCQGALGCCGTVAAICALASIPASFPHALENSIYPTDVSPHGLYFVKVANPDVPFGFAWVAIDSNVSCKPTGKSEFMWFWNGDALAPALFLKAAATMRGGTYDAISNSDIFRKSFKWFPSTTIKTTTFSEFSAVIGQGGMYIFSMTQQYDASGIAINPLGVVYAHAFSAPQCLSTTSSDGTVTNLVRISNPWGGGSDYAGEVAEGSPFWANHPELAGELAVVSQAGGEYWVTWNEFKALTGRTVFEVICPLPLAARPHINYFRYEFDGVPTLSVDWIAELVAGVSSDRIKTLTLAEDTNVTFDLDWLNGSGPRHTDLKIVNATTKLKVAQFTEPVWFGGSGQRQIKLAAGSYQIYPSSRNYNSDRGVLQVVVSSDKAFALSF